VTNQALLDQLAALREQYTQRQKNTTAAAYFPAPLVVSIAGQRPI
jgi:hypothetical protein